MLIDVDVFGQIHAGHPQFPWNRHDDMGYKRGLQQMKLSGGTSQNAGIAGEWNDGIVPIGIFSTYSSAPLTKVVPFVALITVCCIHHDNTSVIVSCSSSSSLSRWGMHVTVHDDYLIIHLKNAAGILCDHQRGYFI